MKHKNKSELTALDRACPFIEALQSDTDIHFVPEQLSKSDLALVDSVVGSRTLSRLREYLLQYFRKRFSDITFVDGLSWFEIIEYLRDSIEPAPEEKQAPATKPVGDGEALLSARETAAMLNVSRAHLYQMAADGTLGPKSVKLGRRVLWRRNELTEWIKADCPDRIEWLNRKQTLTRQG